MALARRVEAIQEWAIIMEKFPIILEPVWLQPPLEPNGDIGGKDQYKKMEIIRIFFGYYILNFLKKMFYIIVMVKKNGKKF